MKQKTKTSIPLVAGQIFPLQMQQPCRETVFNCWLRYHANSIIDLYSRRGKKYRDIELMDFAMYVFDCERGIVEPNLN